MRRNSDIRSRRRLAGGLFCRIKKEYVLAQTLFRVSNLTLLQPEKARSPIDRFEKQDLPLRRSLPFPKQGGSIVHVILIEMVGRILATAPCFGIVGAAGTPQPFQQTGIRRALAEKAADQRAAVVQQFLGGCLDHAGVFAVRIRPQGAEQAYPGF